MDIQLAVSKIKKYATSTSGDTVEVIERPQGGVSVVLADGQSSGKGAKWVSTFVVRKVISLLADGVRDGAAARAASDSLFSERAGKVSASLNIISIDKQTKTIVITRNNHAPAVLVEDHHFTILDEPSTPIGLYRGTRPIITERALQPGIVSVVYSDGLVHCGSRYGKSLNIRDYLEFLLKNGLPTSEFIADSLLQRAMDLDHNRPSDDMSVVVVRVLPKTDDEIRRMYVRLPLGQ